MLLFAVLGETWLQRGDHDWQLLSSAGQALFGGEGLHVYAADPRVQAGPPTLLLVRAVMLLPPGLALGLVWLMLALVGWYLFRLAEQEGARRLGLPDAAASPSYALTSVALGLPLMTMWGMLAGACPHPEDGLTILAATAAVMSIQRGRATRAGLLVGVAMALKPWGVAALPMLFPLEQRRRALAIAVAIPAVCWLPFLLYDPDTLRATGHAFPLNETSPLRAFGLSGELVPSWLRSIQLLTVLAVAVVVTVRGNWRQAFAAGCATRLLLDPGTYDYYIAGLLMVVAVTERSAGQRGWRTLWLGVGLLLVPLFVGGVAMATIRAAVLGVVILGWIVQRKRPAPLPLIPHPRSPEAVEERTASPTVVEPASPAMA